MEAKQRCDFRRNLLGARSIHYTSQFGLKLKELGLCAASIPHSHWLWEGVNKLPDILVSLHMGLAPVPISESDSKDWRRGSWVCRAEKKDSPTCQLYPFTNHALLKTLFIKLAKGNTAFLRKPKTICMFSYGQMGHIGELEYPGSQENDPLG